MKYTNALFSGRFDPPNTGHFLAISRLLTMYRYVVVPILDYPERSACTAGQAQRIFQSHFRAVLPDVASNKLRFIVNREHFGKITATQLSRLMKNCDLRWEDTEYIAGNRPVLKHIRSLGLKGRFLNRVPIEGLDPYVFESSRIRARMASEGKSLEEIYRTELT